MSTIEQRLERIEGSVRQLTEAISVLVGILSVTEAERTGRSFNPGHPVFGKRRDARRERQEGS